jgi:hypothetical protein
LPTPGVETGLSGLDVLICVYVSVCVFVWLCVFRCKCVYSCESAFACVSLCPVLNNTQGLPGMAALSVPGTFYRLPSHPRTAPPLVLRENMRPLVTDQNIVTITFLQL